ncbi:hypothetical protein LCGC14_0579810 [marine sediment metagenome]|uniref:Uncharacterized protein n=1 Tax=marine sediment metagenome TaxID=412755 RepID=A0A0F9RLQ8_9ZZZZ
MDKLKDLAKKVVLNVDVSRDLRQLALNALLQDARGAIHITGDIYISREKNAIMMDYIRNHITDKESHGKLRAIKVLKDTTDLELGEAKLVVEKIIELIKKEGTV